MTKDEEKVLIYSVQTAELYQKLYGIMYGFITYLSNHWFYSIILGGILKKVFQDISVEFKKSERT